MNKIRGYGFRPSDEELIRYLEDVAFGRDSPVQYITKLEDICEFGPWDLPGLSALQQPGCRVWYFIYPLNSKYSKGKLINRATKEGYWKPTGKPRKVMASDTNAEIGIKRILAFHGGRPEGKKSKAEHGSHSRKKAVWVMHEFQLNIATPPNQKTFALGKLMKRSEDAASISSNKGASSHDSQNDENEISNQHNIVAENESSNLQASFENDENRKLSDCELCDVDDLLAMISTLDN